MKTIVRINPKDWKKQKGTAREVYRQLEWFRRAVDERCSAGGGRSGVALELAHGISNTQGFVSLLRSGHRLPDFETACKVALYFGQPLADFLEEGRDVSEGVDVGGRLSRGRQLLGRIVQHGDKRTIEMVLGLLKTAADQLDEGKRAA